MPNLLKFFEDLNCNGFCRKPEYCPEKGGVCLAAIDIAMREAKDEVNYHEPKGIVASKA